MIDFLLKDNIYGFPWVVCFGDDPFEAFRKFIDTFKPDSKDGLTGNPYMTACVFTHSDIGAGCIWFSKKSKIGEIVHECVHATNIALQFNGVKPARDDHDEHYAYYMEWLFNEIFKVWRKANKISNRINNNANDPTRMLKQKQ